MAQPGDIRPITQGLYRERRAYLADHVFFTVHSVPATDLLSEDSWASLTDLPTDVLLRTTDYLGSMVEDMLTQAYAWLTALPIGVRVPFLSDAHLDAHDEFRAAPLIAAHGRYRQATASLRNALEVMTHAVRFAVRNDQAGFQAWRNGIADPPKFGNSSDLVGGDFTAARIDTALGGAGIFGVKPPGVLRSLYADVCRYAHSQPGYTNADIWKSNGPVFIGRAFTQFWLDFCDVLLVSYVLLKVAYPTLNVPSVVTGIPGNAGPGWHGLAPAAVAAYFP